MAYVQKNNPFPVTSCGRRRTFTQGGKPGNDRTKESPYKEADPPKTIGKGKNFNKVAKDKSKTGAAAGGGMTQKGVNAYKAKNPGSNLQTAVTEKNPKGKDKSRQDAFCARSAGWDGERGIAARKRWNC